MTEDELTFSDSSYSSDEDKQQRKDIYIAVTLPRASNNTHPFDVFDLTSLTWSSQVTYGVSAKDVPNLGNGSTLSYSMATHSMYLYGGWNEADFSSDVYCVSMDTWKWEKIAIPGGEIKPSPRYLTGVLMYGTCLCNFGGVGPEIVVDQDEGAKYQGCVEKNIVYAYGWNNEYYEFDTLNSKSHCIYICSYAMMAHGLCRKVGSTDEWQGGDETTSTGWPRLHQVRQLSGHMLWRENGRGQN